MKARIFTIVNENHRMLVQIVNVDNNKVFNSFVEINNHVELQLLIQDIEENIEEVTLISEVGSKLESVKMDRWAYSRGFILETKLNRMF